MNASHASESRYPDASWIKKNVSVLEVGKKLGMEIRQGRAKCWRPDNHAHGDAHPSLHFWERGNRVRCFVCDMKRGHSCIDLVMAVLGIDFGLAVRWIAEHFVVPNIKPGAPIGRRNKVPAPYFVRLPGSEFEVLVRSGMFGQLSHAERSILVVLSVFRNETGITHHDTSDQGPEAVLCRRREVGFARKRFGLGSRTPVCKLTSTDGCGGQI
jgi:hypothetical protein